jgi:Phage Tail Protein X.
MTKYKTIQGDTWDLVAKQQLGSEQYAPLLMAVNQHLNQTLVFDANTELVLPEITTEEVSTLPPWRR